MFLLLHVIFKEHDCHTNFHVVNIEEILHLSPCPGKKFPHAVLTEESTKALNLKLNFIH